MSSTLLLLFVLCSAEEVHYNDPPSTPAESAADPTRPSKMSSEDRPDGSYYHPDNDYAASFALSGKIMMAAIVVLFTVVLFVLCLHIYARCFWRRSGGLSRRPGGSSRRRRLAFAADRDPARLQRIGLEKSVIESLPVYVYQSANHRDGLECAVCLCEFEDAEKVRLLPKCNHSFHIECIDMWFHSHSTCPLCRASAQPDASPSVVAVAEGASSEGEEASSSGSLLDGNPPAQTAPATAEDGDALCASCRHDDGLPSPTYPTNVLFWGSQNQMNSRLSSSKLDQGTSSQKPLRQIVIDIPRRAESFSSPRFFSGEEQQAYSPGGPSSKSPGARLRSLKRLLSRDKKAIAQGPDGVDIEQGGQVQS